MTKVIIFFCFLFCVSTSWCSCNFSKDNLQTLRDSLNVCMQYGFLKNDTALIYKALKLSDTLLVLENNEKAIKNCYRNRSVIFVFLRDGRNAMNSLNMSVRDLPETNIGKMNYNILKYYACNDSDSVTFVLRRNINICDSILKESFIKEYAYMKIQYLYYLYGSEQAKKCIKKICKNHHDFLFLKTLNDWDEFCLQLDEERKKYLELYNLNSSR